MNDIIARLIAEGFTIDPALSTKPVTRADRAAAAWSKDRGSAGRASACANSCVPLNQSALHHRGLIAFPVDGRGACHVTFVRSYWARATNRRQLRSRIPVPIR